MTVREPSDRVSDLTFEKYLPVETNLARKGIFSPGRGRSIPAEISGKDFLGTAGASPPLRLVDLEIVSWLGRRLRQDERTVEFTLYELCIDVFGLSPAGGRNRAIARASLERLALARLNLGGLVCVDAPGPRLKLAKGKWVDVYLLSDLALPVAESREQMASLGGSRGATCKATLADWLVHQLGRGYLTFMDWGTMRSLSGLAKRLWVYLQAEQFDLRRDEWGSLDFDASYTTLSAGEKLAAALGVSFKDPVRFRSQLKGAYAQIEATDPSYRPATFERTRKGGWVMVACKTRERTVELRMALFGAARSHRLLIGSTRRRIKKLQSPWYQDLGPLGSDTDEELPAYSHLALGPLRFYPLRRGGFAGEAEEELRQRSALSRLTREYEAYRAWVHRHPDGVVLRLHGAASSFQGSILHRASCPVIRREPGSRVGARGDSRVCSLDLVALLDWWAEESELPLSTCKRCGLDDPWTSLHPAFGSQHNPDQESLLEPN